jgi:enoyl-CoA hydratase
MAEEILTERQGRVGLIRLNRPAQMNALNEALMDALGAALLEMDDDAGIGALVVTGDERAFAAGADIAEIAGYSCADVAEARFITRNWETIRRVRKPVIAAVGGLALGGGCELALACDIVVAAEDAKFGLPEIKLALLPGAGGTQRLARAIGKAKTMDMCLSARLMGAREAEAAGLVARVVAPGAVLDQALALASKIAAFSAPALRAVKEAVDRAFETSLSEGILFERRALYARFASQDAREGLRAFLEKRQPHFTHR